MPEAYTHIRIARAALRAARSVVPSDAAYEMGANGPDPLFVGALPQKNGACPMAALGTRLHTEKCGAFLMALLQYAKTPVQRSYALGFLTHYAADTTLHPYVAACAAEGGPYARAAGHGFCESALDSFFYENDTGARAVPVDAAAPRLTPKELAEICALLRHSMRTVYEVEVSALALSDAFGHFHLLHTCSYSPHGGKKLLARAVDALVLHKKDLALSHISPCKPPKDGFPAAWHDPFRDADRTGGPHALCLQAAKRAAGYLAAATRMWQRTITPAQCFHLLGSNDYYTGLPCTARKAAQPVAENAPQTAQTNAFTAVPNPPLPAASPAAVPPKTAAQASAPVQAPQQAVPNALAAAPAAQEQPVPPAQST